jgi:type IV pilus assembly protein PilB
MSERGGGLCDLLSRIGAISPEQLEYAARVRAKLRPPRPLLQVVKELGYVTDVGVQEALSAHPGEVRLGELLVDLGTITEGELERALAAQAAKPGRRIGDALLELDILSPEQLYQTLSVQLGHAFVRPDVEAPDAALLKNAPHDWCRTHRFVPIRREGAALVVAFADPLEAQSLAAAKQVFGETPIVRVLATPDAIHQVWERVDAGRRTQRVALVDENEVVGLVDTMLDAALECEASDVHVEPLSDRLRVRFRVDGALMPWRELPSALAASLTSRIKILAKADISERRRHQGGRFVRKRGERELDLRASFYVTVHGEKTVLRLLNRERSLVPVERLGLPPATLARFREDALDRPSGVILITGPTGSGKTTTLYSCVHYINSGEIAIVTAEDPVEYVMDGIAQCSLNSEIDLTYEETLRHIVRQDPDVIVIGEIRDRFSAHTAIQAALTGHKVLSTFHTEDTIGGLVRLLNMEIEAFLISSTVVSVLAQRLLRRVCEACAVRHEPSPMELRRLGYRAGDFEGAELRKGRGCSACRRTGYKGRVGVFEMLVLCEEVRDAILQHRTSYEIRRISRERSGLVSLLEDALVKAARGLTTLDEIVENVPRLDRPRPLHELRRLLEE